MAAPFLAGSQAPTLINAQVLQLRHFGMDAETQAMDGNSPQRQIPSKPMH